MQNIDSDLIRGNIDTIILTTMLDGDKYGLDIIKEVETKSNGTYELKQPTLYSCLKRLENQELISSYWLDSDIGGRRHYYKLTDKGRDTLLKKQEEWTKSKFIIDNLLSNHDFDEYRLVKKEDYDKIIDGKKFDYSPSVDQVSPVAENATLQSETQDIDDTGDVNSNISENEAEIDKNANPSSDYVPSRVNYNDENDEAEADYPNQKRFKIPSIYDDINIDSDNDTPIEENSDDNQNDDVFSVYNGETDDEEDEIDDETSINDYLDAETNDNSDFVNDIVSEYESYLNEPSDEDEFTLGNDEDDENENAHIYFNNLEVDNHEDDDLDLSTNKIEMADQSQNELNILSRLRMQEGEEINEYYGNKNSYTNYLNDNDNNEDDEDDIVETCYNKDIEELKRDDLEVVQEDLLSYNSSLSNDNIYNQIDEFSSAINELNNFSSVSENNYEQYDDQQENETNIEDELINNSNSQEQSSSIINFKSEPNTDDFLNELDALKENENHGFFNSLDSAEYSATKFEPQIVCEPENNYYDESDSSDASFEKQFESYNNQFGYNHTNHVNEEYTSNTDTDDSYYNQSYEEPSNSFSSFDDIILKNIDNYTTDTTKYMASEEYKTFTPKFTSNNYKQKLNNLSAYSKINAEENVVETHEVNEEIMNKVKNIQTLRAEFEDEGICVKEYKKTNGHADVDRNYLLVNKINLVKSLILLFGYVFLLSAVYIIMNNTSAQSIYNFSFKYFLYGFIPFGIYALYYTVLFILNPYKKIPAKFAPRIMIFISVIITIQLLLITYCVNLQLGFYSFTQNYYNHLIWIIPTIISFAPIIANVIYMALYYSKNFNV